MPVKNTKETQKTVLYLRYLTSQLFVFCDLMYPPKGCFCPLLLSGLSNSRYAYI